MGLSSFEVTGGAEEDSELTVGVTYLRVVRAVSGFPQGQGPFEEIAGRRVFAAAREVGPGAQHHAGGSRCGHPSAGGVVGGRQDVGQ